MCRKERHGGNSSSMEPAWKRVWKLERVDLWLFSTATRSSRWPQPARSRRGAALSVITQLVPKPDATLCTVRQAQCSEVSERATRGNCMPGIAPSVCGARSRVDSDRAALALLLSLSLLLLVLEPCSVPLPAPAVVVVVDYGPRSLGYLGRRVAHCCHSCHPSLRPQPRPLSKPLQRQAAYPAWAPVVHCVPSRGCMNRWAPRRSLIVLCWVSIRL